MTRTHAKKQAILFGLTSVLLFGIGFGLTTPVIPYLIEPYIKVGTSPALTIGLLTFVYALCVFFAAPGLGALSDRFGRKPVLIVCLIGSALGYLIFGIGGALWMLFLGRIIDGLTGGNISTILAYFSDITEPNERTRYFGLAGAASGIGFIIGPSLGGLLATWSYTAPVYFGAVVTLLNALYGLLCMPESLAVEKRIVKVQWHQLNPVVQLYQTIKLPNLKWLFLTIFLLGVPAGSLQAFYSQFAKDVFEWQPSTIGLVFSILGATDIATQALAMPYLLKTFKEKTIAQMGIVAEALAYGLIALSGLMGYYPLFVLGTFIFGIGDAIFGPAINGFSSLQVSESQQGSFQGASQSLQSLTRIIGPLAGAGVYANIGFHAPALMGVLFLAVALLALSRSKA